jgi:hypothetical protein
MSHSNSSLPLSNLLNAILGFFPAQVAGESMNRLFTSDPILYFREFQGLN